MPWTPVLHPRRLIMSAYLYYRRALPVLSDGEYDELSNLVATQWDEVEPFLKWQLGSPDQVRATGSHIKITVYAESAACSWWCRVNKRSSVPGYCVGDDEWIFDEEQKVRYVTAEP